jgi:hypothetical protein
VTDLGDDPTLDRITTFLAEIGLSVRAAEIRGGTVLPGITIDRGTLVVDPDKLEHPGDLLHEAGHLAGLAPAERSEVGSAAGADGGREMAAIAWSYAASRHLGLDPSVVFHDDGYRGGSANLIENFEADRSFGVPILQWLGLTAEGPRAAELGIEPFPHMIKWTVE